MVLNYYLKEIKYRILFILYSIVSTFGIIFEFKEEYFNFLVLPLTEIVGNIYFIATNVLEIIFTYIYMSIYYVYIFLIFLFVYNIFVFCVPGITYKVKRKVLNIFKYFLVCFILNLLIVYKIIIYYILRYMLNSGVILNEGLNFYLDFELKIKDYLFFVIKSSLLSQLILLVPLVILLYLKFFNITLKNIIKYRMLYNSLNIIFIIIILPPDMFLHISLILIVSGIFELCIVCIYIFETYKNKLNNSSFGGMVDTVDLKSPPF